MTEQSPEEKSQDTQDIKDLQGPEGVPGRPQKAYEIDVFRDWCKGCGICAAFCPKHCIKLDEDGSPVIAESGLCSGCGWCEIHCPDFAISVHPVKKNIARIDDDQIC